jgi:phosphoribosylamine--glycine ligase
VGRPIRGLEEAEADGAKVFHAGTAMQNGTIVTSGGRVLGITAAGTDLSSAAAAAYAAAARIHFDGMHYRRDIARKGLARSRPL